MVAREQRRVEQSGGAAVDGGEAIVPWRRTCAARARNSSSSRCSPCAMELCIFNPSLGGEETADQKLLFYHPARTPIDAQLKVVGLSEALGVLPRTSSAGRGPR